MIEVSDRLVRGAGISSFPAFLNITQAEINQLLGVRQRGLV
jgi:hypothetical protein